MITYTIRGEQTIIELHPAEDLPGDFDWRAAALRQTELLAAVFDVLVDDTSTAVNAAQTALFSDNPEARTKLVEDLYDAIQDMASDEAEDADE